ncbi:hypothetical protein [Devosia sp.]|uniref:hypothetical protein n=1 Tax=Devosia sp. TaxID=1871048 RepID=UPI001ACCD797|nr:hypothetical protein [Devosia sp.]MBN9308996.1 hypothetical protein [Devosia sp.]
MKPVSADEIAEILALLNAIPPERRMEFAEELRAADPGLGEMADAVERWAKAKAARK